MLKRNRTLIARTNSGRQGRIQAVRRLQGIEPATLELLKLTEKQRQVSDTHRYQRTVRYSTVHFARAYWADAVIVWYRFSRRERLMKRTNKLPSHIDTASSRASSGGTVSHYGPKQIIYSQGTPAFTLFYIQEGGCASPADRSISPQRLPPSWEWVISLVGFAW
jgi:hypothetical protein